MIVRRPATRRLALAPLVFAAAALASGCDFAPARRIEADYVAPDKVLDFAQLYGANCAGCHGDKGRGGAALALANPTYLAIAGDDAIRRAIADGMRGTPMPAFARRSGGLLTDAQLDSIVKGIRTWTKPAEAAKPAGLSGVVPPPYADASPGDPQRGGAVFAIACARCHGGAGEGGRGGSTIADGSYLALVSNQGLRTAVIAGRPDLGAPDWRGSLPDRAMTSQEVSDVVAWLAAQRPAFPGAPHEQTQRLVEPSPAPSRDRGTLSSRPSEVHP